VLSRIHDQHPHLADDRYQEVQSCRVVTYGNDNMLAQFTFHCTSVSLDGSSPTKENFCG